MSRIAVTAAAAGPSIPGSDRAYLRWLADTYERVQEIRLEAGERIRAVAQGRTASGSPLPVQADALLARIRLGAEDGPVPVLGHTYRLHWREERRLRLAMGAALRTHFAWPWLRSIRGVGPTLSVKLLARLDIHRARWPSSFWAYCGLSTVPAVQHWCPVCGLTRVVPEHAPVRWRHARAGTAECPGRLLRRPGTGIRMAPPPPARGQRPLFDPAARRVCYQLGVSLLRSRGHYADFYRRQRIALAESERGWTPAHTHMAAMRKMTKLFLVHLWTVWAAEEGLPPRTPYAHRLDDHHALIDPWRMAQPTPTPLSAIEAKNPE